MTDSYSNGYKSLYYSRDTKRGKLEPEDVINIRKFKDKLTQQELADFYDVGRTTIAQIHRNERWTNINKEEI